MRAVVGSLGFIVFAAGCCANSYEVVQPATAKLGTYDTIRIGTFAIPRAGEMSSRTRGQAEEVSSAVASDLAQRIAMAGSGQRVLLVNAELDYAPPVPFYSGKAVITVSFVDAASGQLVAKTTVKSNAHESGWGCTTGNTLGGGVGNFVDDNR